jgi:hypothetical protein
LIQKIEIHPWPKILSASPRLCGKNSFWIPAS